MYKSLTALAILYLVVEEVSGVAVQLGRSLECLNASTRTPARSALNAPVLLKYLSVHHNNVHGGMRSSNKPLKCVMCQANYTKVVSNIHLIICNYKYM